MLDYKRTIWENNKTPLNETNLNNIEEGILQAQDKINIHTSLINKNIMDINKVNQDLAKTGMSLDDLIKSLAEEKEMRTYRLEHTGTNWLTLAKITEPNDVSKPASALITIECYGIKENENIEGEIKEFLSLSSFYYYYTYINGTPITNILPLAQIPEVETFQKTTTAEETITEISSEGGSDVSSGGSGNNIYGLHSISSRIDYENNIYIYGLLAFPENAIYDYVEVKINISNSKNISYCDKLDWRYQYYYSYPLEGNEIIVDDYIEYQYTDVISYHIKNPNIDKTDSYDYIEYTNSNTGEVFRDKLLYTSTEHNNMVCIGGELYNKDSIFPESPTEVEIEYNFESVIYPISELRNIVYKKTDTYILELHRIIISKIEFPCVEALQSISEIHITIGDEIIIKTGEELFKEGGSIIQTGRMSANFYQCSPDDYIYLEYYNEEGTQLYLDAMGLEPIKLKFYLGPAQSHNFTIISKIPFSEPTKLIVDKVNTFDTPYITNSLVSNNETYSNDIVLFNIYNKLENLSVLLNEDYATNTDVDNKIAAAIGSALEADY